MTAARLAPVVAAVLTSLWMFRDTFLHDRLPGDIGDARWTTAITEHWYRVWTGEQALRDLTFFVPERHTLGVSDAFFVQGQIYALLRALGVGILDAWFLCHFVAFVIGAVGVAVLSRRLFGTVPAQVAFVVLACASYPLIIQFGHNQVVGFLSVSWLVVGFDAIHTAATTRGVRTGLALVLLALPLLALSSWYGFALGVTLLAALGAYMALLHDGREVAATLRSDGGRAWAAARSPLGAAIVVAAVELWAFAAWIYLPVLSILPDPSWAEVTLYSPRWSDLVNAASMGGGVWGPLYDRVFDGALYNSEQALGFTPILLVAFLVVGLETLRRLALRRDEPEPRDPVAPGRASGAPVLAGTRGLLACFLAVVTVSVFFLVDERGIGLFQLVWGRIPGTEAVRAPFRGQILVYPVVTFVVLRSVERLVLRLGRSTDAGAARTASPGRQLAAFVLGVVLVVGIAVEMHRPSAWRWTSDDLLAPALRARVDDVHDRCDAVILTERPAERPVWASEIDAVVLSMLADVPTPQGYSRASPIGHPGFGAPPDALVAWMRDEGFDGSICLVDGLGLREA